VAEEHGKGVALVILGIVAIIAIVGLVLLFTGARKAATGDFVAPSVKAYGGAILDESAVERSARAGYAGSASQFYARGIGSAGVGAGGQCYGDSCTPEQVISSQNTLYNDEQRNNPASWTCTTMARLSGLPQLSEPSSAQEAQNGMQMGRQCVAIQDLVSVANQVDENSYGTTRDAVEYAKSLGVSHCCEAPGLSGTV